MYINRKKEVEVVEKEKDEGKTDKEKEKEEKKYKFPYKAIIFFDDMNMYVIKIGVRKINTKYEQNCRFVRYFSNEVNYAICEGVKVEDSGLFYYNLDEIIKYIDATEVKSLPFKLFEIGCNTDLVFCPEEGRIGYFNTLSHLTIVPLLHTNLIKFIGINKPEDYLTYKVE